MTEQEAIKHAENYKNDPLRHATIELEAMKVLVKALEDRDARIAKLDADWICSANANNRIIVNIERSLAGTNCTSVEELRRKCDTAMAMLNQYINDVGEFTHGDIQKIYYEARLP